MAEFRHSSWKITTLCGNELVIMKGLTLTDDIGATGPIVCLLLQSAGISGCWNELDMLTVLFALCMICDVNILC
jgi:hypothetical protein